MRFPSLVLVPLLLIAGCDWTTDEPTIVLDETRWRTSFTVYNALFGADEAWRAEVHLQEFLQENAPDLSGTANWTFKWIDPDPWLEQDSLYSETEFLEGERYRGDSLQFALYTEPASDSYDCIIPAQNAACVSVRPAVLYFFGAVTSDSTISGYGVTHNGTSYTRVDDLVFSRHN